MSEHFNTPSVLLLGLPTSAFCGIDLLSFTTSPRFNGIKNLPSGWHFVFTGVTNSFSLRHGAWFHVQDPQPTTGRELFILKWDAEHEELVPETDEAEILRHRANIGRLWRENLTPYRQSAVKDGEAAAEDTHDWVQLTDCITPSLLSRITGIDTPSNTTKPTPRYWLFTSASSAAQDVDAIPGLSGTDHHHPRSEKELSFLPIDLKQTWRPGAIGRERTEAAQDRSWALGQLIQSHCSASPRDVIGELQITFLLILTLNNNSALEQWKRLLGLVLTCKEAAGKQPSFFCEFVGVLRWQVVHCADAEGGLFDLSDEGGSLLRVLLRRFRVGLEGLEVEGRGKADVLEELDDLEAYLRDEYGWYGDGAHMTVRRGMLELEDGEQIEMDMNDADEEDESGDFAPAIVDLTPEQMRELSSHGATFSIPDERSKAAHMKKQQARLAEMVNQNEEEDDQDIEDMDARY